MGDTAGPCLVLLDGGDGELEQVLGLAFAARVPSPPPFDMSLHEGKTAEPATSGSQNVRSWSFTRSSSQRSNSFRFPSTRLLTRRPSIHKLKGALQRWLRFAGSSACDDIQLNQIVPLLFSTDNRIIQEQAARALVQLSCEEAHKSSILEYPRAVDGLVKLLFEDDSPNLQIHAARSLANLALVEDGEERLWFLGYPDALVGLVCLLFDGASTALSRQRSREITMQVRQEAAVALGNIASKAEGGAMIMRNSHAIEGLIRLLFIIDGRGAQEAATSALVHLAMVEENVPKLLELPISVVGGLSGLLLDHSRPALQEKVCKALAYLSATSEHAEMIVRSVHFSRALKRLTSLLALQNPSAILPLANLAINEEIQATIANFDNVLEAALMVMRVPRVGTSRRNQHYVPLFLGNLSLAKANRRKILECPGFLPAMVDMLFNDADSHGQEQAAWTLSNLSRAQPGNLQMISKIADWPGILGGLIHVLGKEENPGAQEQAARVLANLSYAPENDPIFARFPDAWTSLVPLLSKRDNISMQQEVTRALSNLTNIDCLSQRSVTSECVTSLASLILEYSSPAYRISRLESVILEQAALALGNLLLNQSNRWKGAHTEDGVAALLALWRCEYPNVQEKAAWALTRLFQDEYLRATGVANCRA